MGLTSMEKCLVPEAQRCPTKNQDGREHWLAVCMRDVGSSSDMDVVHFITSYCKSWYMLSSSVIIFIYTFIHFQSFFLADGWLFLMDVNIHPTPSSTTNSWGPGITMRSSALTQRTGQPFFQGTRRWSRWSQGWHNTSHWTWRLVPAQPLRYSQVHAWEKKRNIYHYINIDTSISRYRTTCNHNIYAWM